MSSDSHFRLDAFLDGVTGAGLFGWLRQPGAPTELIDSSEQSPGIAATTVLQSGPSLSPLPQLSSAATRFGGRALTHAPAASVPERPHASGPSPSEALAATPVNTRS